MHMDGYVVYQDCLPDLTPAGCFRVGDASATMLLVRVPGKFWWFELTLRISENKC
jgi:hypothetical protein